MWVEELIDAYPFAVSAVTKDTGDTPLHLFCANAAEKHRRRQEQQPTNAHVPRNIAKLIDLLISKEMPRELDESTMEEGTSVVMDLEHLPLFITNHQGLTPLHVAALFGTPACLIKPLLDHPLQDVVSALPADQGGGTALHLACHSQTIDEDIVLVLCNRAACEAFDFKGRDAIMVALLNKKRVPTNVVKALLKECPESAQHICPGNGFWPLHYAVRNRHVRVSSLERIYKAGPDAIGYGCTVRGNLPLHEACRSDISFSTVEFLLDKYPWAIRVQNDEGLTAEDIAKEYAKTSESDKKTSKKILKALAKARKKDGDKAEV